MSKQPKTTPVTLSGGEFGGLVVDWPTGIAEQAVEHGEVTWTYRLNGDGTAVLSDATAAT